VLREMSREWTVKQTCVFVYGPPNIRADFSNTIAGMQKLVWEKDDCEEIILYTENYALQHCLASNSTMY